MKKDITELFYCIDEFTTGLEKGEFYLSIVLS
jgi:hypothetical protein